jgi:hypothetical protein
VRFAIRFMLGLDNKYVFLSVGPSGKLSIRLETQHMYSTIHTEHV